jgi:hypothetical protein
VYASHANACVSTMQVDPHTCPPREAHATPSRLPPPMQPTLTCWSTSVAWWVVSTVCAKISASPPRSPPKVLNTTSCGVRLGPTWLVFRVGGSSQ